MRNLIIFSLLAVLIIINFSGCGKAQERPVKLNKELSGKVISLKDLDDGSQNNLQDTPENLSFKRQLISKIEDADKRIQAELLLSQNRLVYQLSDGKASLFEISDIKSSNTWAEKKYSLFAEIEIQTGLLENETTDYNEKKSTLTLTTTPLSEAQVLIIKSEIKKNTDETTTDKTATNDSSDDESK